MTSNSANFDLSRFADAQADVFAGVLEELQAGCKRSHWMWFIFPQIAGLGHSATARTYAITGLPEAVAYLAHPILGERLERCTKLTNAIAERSALQIFGSPDDLKFRSSMTLFARAASGNSVFVEALDKYFGGRPDDATLRILTSAGISARQDNPPADKM